jgi:hypothetical protein
LVDNDHQQSKIFDKQPFCRAKKCNKDKVRNSMLVFLLLLSWFMLWNAIGTGVGKMTTFGTKLHV